MKRPDGDGTGRGGLRRPCPVTPVSFNGLTVDVVLVFHVNVSVPAMFAVACPPATSVQLPAVACFENGRHRGGGHAAAGATGELAG